MSEFERNPAIHIHIDQQVFIDSVIAGDSIEDPTVSTEVVGFDRVQDEYVLDGAIVFTGYIRHSDQQEREITAEDLNGDVSDLLADEEEITVQQIHCRMPFHVEVPVDAQPEQ